jgi:hypothetical protein
VTNSIYEPGGYVLYSNHTNKRDSRTYSVSDKRQSTGVSSKLRKQGEHWRLRVGHRTFARMLKLMYAAVFMLVGRFRSRTELGLEIVALRHQLTSSGDSAGGRAGLSAIEGTWRRGA